MSKKSVEISPDQIRWNVFIPEPKIIIPRQSVQKYNPERGNTIYEKETKGERLPDVAYMNSENLGLIRERIKFNGSDEELIGKLVVFMGRKTEIKLDHKEKFTTNLNIGVIAQETLYIDEWQIPEGYKYYQLLGVYSEYKATGKVSTDKSVRDYATIQRSNCPHPETFHLGGCFLAKSKDAIKVKKSKYEKTGYFWNKK
ncbi:MAG: hypothetical protein PHX34_04030 [Candidatus Shapirobacteria bacterium]|nr:hypothetical protein [Candidatus Shapirobacteria bacterium]